MSLACHLYILGMVMTHFACMAHRFGSVFFASLSSFCLFTTDSGRTDTLPHCCFPFLLSSSSSPRFAASPFYQHHFHVFSHLGQHGDHLHSDKPVVFRVFPSQTVPVFHSYLLDLLLYSS